MKMNEQDQIQLFTELKEKETSELMAMLETRGLETAGEKLELINRIIRSGPLAQIDSFQPQALAIQTKGNDNAQEWMRCANARILPQDKDGNLLTSKINRKVFTFVKKDGGTYEVNCPYVRAKPETVQMLLDNGWVSPLDNQVDLINQMRKDITNFQCSFIRKRDSKNHWYTMVHVELLQAA